MDTRHLEYFVTVAEELSFTRAAQRLNAGQSTVSAGITALERELGTTLFHRTTRRVELAVGGRELLPMAQEAVAAVQGMRQFGAQTRQGLRGRIRFGILTNIEWLDLPAVLGRFHREHPMVQLSLRISPAGSSGVLADVRADRLDIALCGLSRPQLIGVRGVRLRRQPFVAVLPPDHPKAGLDEVALADLLDDPFVDVPAGFGNRVQLDNWIAEQGLRRQVTTEVPDLSTVTGFVAAGLGIAVVPAQAVLGRTDVAQLSVTPPLTWEMFAITGSRRRDPAVAALLELLVQTAREDAGRFG